MDHLAPFDRALLIVDAIVLGGVPPALDELRCDENEQRPLNETPGHLFENDPERFRAALEAALSAWIDLRVLFTPSRHALRANHDEYTTLFSESPGKIADSRRILNDGGVEKMEYTADPP